MLELGATYGCWTIIEYNKEYSKYYCQCKCGYKKFVQHNNLISNLKSCRQCRNYLGIMRYIWPKIEKRAKTKNIKLLLTPKEAELLIINQNFKCAISGINIELSNIKGVLSTASLDRKDSNLPYSYDNCQWVHKIINLAKGSLDNEEFISLCNDVVNLHKDFPNKEWYKCDYSTKKIRKSRKDSL